MMPAVGVRGQCALQRTKGVTAHLEEACEIEAKKEHQDEHTRATLSDKGRKERRARACQQLAAADGRASAGGGVGEC